LLKRYNLDYLVHASSLIADEATGTAVIVVPQRDMNQHLAEAQTHGWQLSYIFLCTLVKYARSGPSLQGEGKGVRRC
jgi:hypothetical protein